MLSDHHKTQQMGATLTFLQRYHDEGEDFLTKFTRKTWEVFDHLPYSPNLSHSDFHLFAHMKRCLAGQLFGTDSEL